MSEQTRVLHTHQDAALPVAPSLRPALAELASILPAHITSRADIDRYRAAAAARGTDAAEVSARFGLDAADLSVDGAPAVTRFVGVSSVARVVFLHGGGLVAGNRFDGVDLVARHAVELGLEIWTVEYPLAPEHTLPEMVDAVCAVVSAAGADGLDVLIAGQSAGGGLAAAVTLACRDRGIRVDGQMLVCPMITRADSASTRQYADDPSWSRESNEAGWRAALSGTEAVPPGERADLVGLPPAYLDTATAELFRDAIAAFTMALWAHGCRAELHTWSGAFHGSDCVDDSAAVSIEAHRARREWLRRWLQGDL